MIVAPNKPPGARPLQKALQSDAAAAQKSVQQQQAPPAEPAEAIVLKDLLKSLGIRQYDPRIIDLLMDLTYRTASDILRDAEAINVAAGGSGAELTPQDIALAASQQARLHPQPPTLAELHALARRVNAQPLTGPSDKQHGIKLPPVADCLLSQNYQLKPQPPAQPPPRPPAAGPGPQRQHLAVRQQHSIGVKIPQQWQPAADTAGAAAEPFPPPAQRQPQGALGEAPPPHQQQQMGGQQQQQPGGMDIEREEI